MANNGDNYKTIGLRAPKEWLAQLDKWIASQPVPPARADVIKLAVAQFIDRQIAEAAARRKR